MDTREIPQIEQLIIYRAILKAGKPISLIDLHHYLLNKFPAIKWNRNIILQALLDDERIVQFLKSSRHLYVLKVFEKEPEIKKEKIHVLVSDFVKAHEGPVHISEIEKYISKFHDVDQKTLKLIIKVDLKHHCIPLSGCYYEYRVRETTFEKSSRKV